MKLNKILSTAIILLGLASNLRAQGTAFTYQGQLMNGGAPANGNFDFTFALFNNNSTNSGQLGATLTNFNVGVSNGLFSVSIDFGSAFTGSNTWLAIGVEANGGTNFTELSPLQELTPAPYALYAPNAGTASNLSGTIAASQVTGTVPITQIPSNLLTNGQAGVTLGGVFTGDGGGLTNLNLLQLGVGSVATVSSADTPGSLVERDSSGNFAAGGISGSFSGDGGGLTNLNASQLSSGTLAAAQLPAIVLTNGQSGVMLTGLTTASNLAVAGTNAVNFLVVSNAPVFDGSALTNLSAGQISGGTLALAQLPAAVVTNGQIGVTLGGVFTGSGAGLTNTQDPNVAILSRATNIFGGTAVIGNGLSPAAYVGTTNIPTFWGPDGDYFGLPKYRTAFNPMASQLILPFQGGITWVDQAGYAETQLLNSDTYGLQCMSDFHVVGTTFLLGGALEWRRNLSDYPGRRDWALDNESAGLAGSLSLMVASTNGPAYATNVVVMFDNAGQMLMWNNNQGNQGIPQPQARIHMILTNGNGLFIQTPYETTNVPLQIMAGATQTNFLVDSSNHVIVGGFGPGGSITSKSVSSVMSLCAPTGGTVARWLSFVDLTTGTGDWTISTYGNDLVFGYDAFAGANPISSIRLPFGGGLYSSGVVGSTNGFASYATNCNSGYTASITGCTNTSAQTEEFNITLSSATLVQFDPAGNAWCTNNNVAATFPVHLQPGAYWTNSGTVTINGEHAW